MMTYKMILCSLSASCWVLFFSSSIDNLLFEVGLVEGPVGPEPTPNSRARFESENKFSDSGSSSKDFPTCYVSLTQSQKTQNEEKKSIAYLIAQT